jgi:hypothetical protein
MVYVLKNEDYVKIPNNIGFFEYFVMLVLILYVGLANQLVLFHSFKEKPIVFFVPILLSGILQLSQSSTKLFILRFWFNILPFS